MFPSFWKGNLPIRLILHITSFRLNSAKAEKSRSFCTTRLVFCTCGQLHYPKIPNFKKENKAMRSSKIKCSPGFLPSIHFFFIKYLMQQMTGNVTMSISIGAPGRTRQQKKRDLRR